MNYYPYPKSEFIQDPNAVKNHHALVENLTLRRHIEIALLEMQRRSAAGTTPSNFNECAASHLRMLGAQDFVAILLNLAETEAQATRSDNTNLPGNVPTRKN